MRHVVRPDRVDLCGVCLRLDHLVDSTGRGGSRGVQDQHVQHLVTGPLERVWSGRVMLLLLRLQLQWLHKHAVWVLLLLLVDDVIGAGVGHVC